jgi:hypothetical protein
MDDKKAVEIKDYFLALNGKCMLPYKIDNGHNYRVEVDVIIDSENEKINKSTGDKSLYFKGELDGLAKITKDNGEIIIANTTKSQSKLLRNQAFHLGRDYESDMQAIRHLYESNIIDLIDQFKAGEIE